MADTTIYTVKGTFVPPEPISYLSLSLLFSFYYLFLVPLIPPILILFQFFFVPVRHNTSCLFSLLTVIPLSSHRNHVSLSNGVLHDSCHRVLHIYCFLFPSF